MDFTLKKYVVLKIQSSWNFVIFLIFLGCQLVVTQEGIPYFIFQGLKDINHEFDSRAFKPLEESYDFIIIGGGSAGCTVANRLTEIPDWSVLVLEAGDDENLFMDIPIAAHLLQLTSLNWDYKSYPSNDSCLAMKNNQCKIPRGKVLGGTSVINLMTYSRGCKRDYDNWEDHGITGWSYDDVLPYFLKSEDMLIPEFAKDTTYHSTGGYLKVDEAQYKTPLAYAFLEAGRELGYPIVDYNGEKQKGFAYCQNTMTDGSRWSATRAFIDPIRGRKNLRIMKRSFVTKIIVDDNKVARAVEFIHNGITRVIKAKKEVILSAGVINSPQILMLSGIGPKEHLVDIGIQVVHNLSVGYNYMDHVALIGLTFLINDTVGLRFEDIIAPDSVAEYIAHKNGPVTIPGGFEASSFFDLENPTSDNPYPNLEIFFMPISIAANPSSKAQLGVDDETWETVYKPIEHDYAWHVLSIALHPKSRGRLILKNQDPKEKPLILGNYLDQEEDVDVILQGVKKAIEISETKAFQKYESKLHDIPIPRCADLPFGSDEYWKCAIRSMTVPIYHPTGTCKMGPHADPDAVVDLDLKVYGIDRLRVIDASVMPIIPSAHTNAPTIMIAEKACDNIKRDWVQ